MATFLARSIIKAIPVVVGAVGAWLAANYTMLHSVFCTGGNF